jgi:aminoglycoside 3-N-acetyltransferase
MSAMQLQELREKLKNISPQFIRKGARTAFKLLRDFRNASQRVSGKKLNVTSLTQALRDVGLGEGDTVLVHSSLSRLGFVQGGAPTVVQALKNAVGPSGTLGAPTFWTLNPIEEPQDAIFDVLSAPSRLGAISESIRREAGASRSLHPTHCASFLGPNAKDLIAGHEQDQTPCGPKSPYFRLKDFGGKILLLGVSIEYLTNFHTIDDIYEKLSFKVYHDETRSFRVLRPDGTEIRVLVRCHNQELSRIRNCIPLEPFFQKLDVIRFGYAGQAQIRLLDARKLYAALVKLAGENITMYHDVDTRQPRS